MSTNTDDGEQLDAGEVAVRANAVIDGLRRSLANELGDSGHQARDWYNTFGWPNRGNNADWDADNYYALYLRNAYAYAVVAQKPKTTWKHEPEVRDRVDQEEDAQREPTEFEHAITKLDREHDLWHYAHRVDRMAGIGRHGLLVIDYADTNGPEDFEEPFTGVENASGLDMINGYRVYPEPMIEDIEWGGPGSDRWGQPVEYTIDLGDDADAGTQDEQNTTLTVHHSRVVDVPARVLDDDETRARPRQEPVLNNILDIEKALGSTAELSYRAADYGLNVNLDPEKVDTSGDALDMMEEDLQNWYHGLQPFLRTTGADVERLGGEVKDPTGIVDNNVRAISTQTGIPQRVLEGASLGELASAEKDERQYFGMISERQEQYAEPYIARAIINHHLDDGVLPDFKGDWYDIIWSDLTELSEQEEADVMETRSTVVTNLQTAVPGLSGERAEEFVETGEFPEREEATGNAPLDEDDPRVREAFFRMSGSATANDWTPELHPRDGEGKFASVPGSGIADMLDEVHESFFSRSSDVNIGGRDVEGSPVLREAFDRENTPLKQASLDALDDSFVKEKSYGPDRHGSHSEFNAWREEQSGSLLNDNTAELWGAAIDDTGNDNVPEDAVADPTTYGDPLPAVSGDEPTTAIGDSVSTTRDVMRQIFGDRVPVVRGVSGEFAEEIRGARENGEEIELEHRALESWTTLPEHAQQFANEGDGDGVLITTEVPVEQVYGASHTTPALHEEENEIIAALDSSETYSPEQIHDGSDEGLRAAYSRLEGSQ